MRRHSTRPTRPRTARARLVPVAALAALALTACAPGAADAPTSAPTQTAPPATSELSGELTIFAAASLQLAFDEIAAAFEAEHPGVDIQPISYDGSSTLATQIIEGAPVDVFASANESNMKKVVDAGLVGEGTLFATNTLVIAVPDGNPGGVESLADFANPDLSIVLCDAEVPCGAASLELLELAGVTATPVSLEQNVTAVRTKVAANEADAGLVYGTDVAGFAGVESIVPPQAAEVINRYPLAALDGAPNPEVARAFVEFVLGPEGQAVLKRLGFGRP
ncbi:MAG TPA: molybdate ABC transporter substrate-binding protein [Microbacteriaceae bacterium]|nr:molybdate ABC transporter substrate-binding protein [Microbacteriaceae bacterium]